MPDRPVRWRSEDAPPRPPLPGVVAGMRALRDLPRFYGGAARRYGTRWLLRLPERDWLMSAEPDDARRLVAAEPDVALAGEASASLRPVGGARSVVLLDGAEHLRMRRVLLPPFHGERVAAYERTMSELVDEMIDGWAPGQVVNLHAAAQELTFAIILRTVLGISDPGAAAEAQASIEALFGLASRVLYVPALQRDLGPLSPWRRFLAQRERADAVVHRELARRRAEADLDQRDDVVSVLLRARRDDGSPLGDDELRDQVMTLLVAGHETTAAAIAWTLDLLLRDPPVLRRLRDGDEDYLDAVLDESLRHRPPVPMFGRVLAEPMEVGQYTVPAGVAVAINVWSLHHRDDLYEEPDRFRPERFLAGDPPPYAHLPFGGGVRRCLGAAFARRELRVAVRALVGRRRLEPVRSTPERFRLRGVTLVPSPGVLVRVVS